jgi:plasmid stability protein
MKNVTITLDEEVARWARIRAAERNTSVSRMLGELLKEEMRAEKSYRQAMEHFLAQKPRVLRKPETPLPKREELYDR